MTTLTFKLNRHLYIRDPQHSDLGQRIISESITMIAALGVEKFTFKKLAGKIDCTEASVYRYFENKHRLLVYLVSWYWHWIEYCIDKAITNINEPERKLKECLRIISEEKKYDPTFEFVNEEALHRIVIAEFNKMYLTKSVDDENEEGLFGSFKSLCKKITEIVLEIKPTYTFPSALVSSLLVASTQQIFFAEHLPSLTNIKSGKSLHDDLYLFLENLAFGAIQKN